MTSPGLVIETARLRLRPFREADLADLVRLIGIWEVARWVSNVPHPYTEADGRTWIALVQEDHAAGRPRRFAIASRDSDQVIGGIGFDGDPGADTDEAALGYWIGQPYWRQGYAREAVAAIIDYGFRTLGLETIRAYTDPANALSQKVLLSCGFTYVGDLDLSTPTRNGAQRAPLFRITAQDARTNAR